MHKHTEAIICEARYGPRRSMAEIARMHGVSRERVRQVLRAAGLDYMSQVERRMHPPACPDCGQPVARRGRRCVTCFNAQKRAKPLCAKGHSYQAEGYYLGAKYKDGKHYYYRKCRLCARLTCRRYRTSHRVQDAKKEG